MDRKMKRLLPALLLFSVPLFAAEDEPANYCHDDSVEKDWARMLAETPTDPIIIKLFGLREGLCGMIDRGQITLEQGIDIWNDEHSRSVLQRSEDEAKRRKKYDL